MKTLILTLILAIPGGIATADVTGPHIMRIPVPQDWVHREVQPEVDTGEIRWNRCTPCHSGQAIAKANIHEN